MDATILNILPPPSQQYRSIESQEDQQQDSEEEIKAIIEDELACLRQENECLRLMQEHMARWRAIARRSQIMQQQIEQERATQAELRQAIETLL
jgi:predicted DNA-binding ArsR family transcriptional regulator